MTTPKAPRRSSIRTACNDPVSRAMNQQRAYWEGKNPVITIENPNRENTKERKIRVRANELWGNPKDREKNRYIMGGTSS